MNTPAAMPAPPRRVRKRQVIPTVLLILLLALLAGAVVRGTWADDAEKNPATSADGVVTQLLNAPDGRKVVRAALVVDTSAEAVWAVVSDYDHFAETFPYLGAFQAEPLGDDRYHVTGIVTTPFGDWPFGTRVRHEQGPAQFRSAWDEPGPGLPVNRGGWTVRELTPGPPARTLLVYNLELEVRPYPTFLVRNVLLSRLPPLLVAAAQRACRQQGGPW